ncbi:MAG: hypothetical protein KIT08_00115 [Anaerolineales bacterium]|nr:MAG: hypothetical protein KIT08_00115 [Anaerolineales bacterium]
MKPSRPQTPQTLIERILKALERSTGFNSTLLTRFSKILTAERVFWGSLALYIAIQAFIASPVITRMLPAGGDDGYSYILKAAQLRDCPLQDCKALEDLREQFLLPTDNLDSAYIRNRQFTRIILLSHHFYTFILLMISKLGVSLETAFDILFFLGKIIVPCFIAYWIHSLWGSRTASLALFLLTPIVFTSHGLSLPVASVLAIALSCLVWGLVLNRHKHLDPVLVPLAIILILMHPMGVIYSFIALCLYLLLAPSKVPKSVLINSAIIFALCLVNLLLPKFLERPTLEFSTVSFYPGNWSYLRELRDNLDFYAQVFVHTAQQLPNTVALVVLVWLGLKGIPSSNYFKFLLSALAVLSLIAFAALYVVPWYGGFTLVRVWPLLAILLIALVANGFDYLLRYTNATKRSGQTTSLRLLSTVLLLALGTSLAKSTLKNYQAAASYQQAINEARDFYINPLQSKLLDDSGGTILYMDELGMYYFLSHGGLSHGAVYEPALRRTPDLQTALEQTDPIVYIVQRNLLYESGMPLTSHLGIQLSYDTQLLVRSEYNLLSDSWQLFLEETAEPFVLKLESEEASHLIAMQPGPAHWFSLPSDFEETSILGISVESGLVAIGGIRPASLSETQWPWDIGLSLEYVTTQERHNVNFDSSRLADNLLGQLTVLDDYGYLTIASTKTQP